MEKAEDEFLWKTLEKLLVPPYWDLVKEEKDEKGKTKQVVLPLDPTLKKMSWGIVSAIYFAIRNDVYSPNSVVTPPTKTESTGSFG